MDPEDSIENFNELKGEVSSTYIIFLSIIRFYADASASEKKQTEALLPHLLNAKVFSAAELEYTFEFFFPDIPELVYDTPFLSRYVGTILGLVLASGVLSIDSLHSNEALKNLIPINNQAFILVASALSALAQAKPNTTSIKGFDLSKFVKDGSQDTVQQLLEKHKFDSLRTYL